MTPSQSAPSLPILPVRTEFWLWGLLAVGAVLPILAPAFFPSVDLWNHLAIHEAQRQAITGQGPLAGGFVFHWNLQPYSAGYATLALLRTFLSPLAAGAAALALSHLLLVLGARALGRALRVPDAVSLLSFAACFSMAVWYGFLNYAISLGILFWVLAQAARTMEEGGTRRMVALAVAWLLLFEAHAESYAAAGFLAGCAALAHPERWRRLGRLALSTLPSMVPVAWWLLGPMQGTAPDMGLFYGPLKDRLGLWQLHNLMVEGWAGMVGAGVAIVGCGALITRGRALHPSVVGLALGSLAWHFILPKAVEGGTTPTWGLSLRTGPISTVCFMLCWGALPARLLARGLWVASALVLLMDIQAWRFASGFSAELEPLATQLAQTRPGTRAVVAAEVDQDQVLGSTFHYLEHLGPLWMLHGAVTRQVFDFLPTRLEHITAALPPGPSELDGPVCTWAPRLDQVLIQGNLPELTARLPTGGFTRAWAGGRWSLWSRTAPVPPCLP